MLTSARQSLEPSSDSQTLNIMIKHAAGARLLDVREASSALRGSARLLSQPAGKGGARGRRAQQCMQRIQPLGD